MKLVKQGKLIRDTGMDAGEAPIRKCDWLAYPDVELGDVAMAAPIRPAETLTTSREGHNLFKRSRAQCGENDMGAGVKIIVP